MAEVRKNGVSESPAASLGFTHPLYLHPSDTQGATIVSQILTGCANYTIWSKSIRIALRGKHKLGFVDGTCTKASQDEGLHEQWERCNAVVLSWILNSLSPELANGVVYFQDAHLVWMDLKERFDKVTGSRIFTVHREIHSLQQGGLSISHYYSKLKELWEEYSALVGAPTCNCCKCGATKAQSDLLQQQKLLQFLMGLNETYNVAKSQILLMSPLPSVNQAFAMLSEDEAQRAIVAMPKNSAIEGIVMTAKGRGRGRNRGRGTGTPPECSHCGKRGHTKDHCFQLIGYPADFRGSKTKASQDSAL